MKKLFVLLSFLLTIISTGCSNDDNDTPINTVNFLLEDESGHEKFIQRGRLRDTLRYVNHSRGWSYIHSFKKQNLISLSLG